MPVWNSQGAMFQIARPITEPLMRATQSARTMTWDACTRAAAWAPSRPCPPLLPCPAGAHLCVIVLALGRGHLRRGDRQEEGEQDREEKEDQIAEPRGA